MKKWAVLVSALMIGLALSGCFGGQGGSIVIGGKNFTEQDILVYLMKETIEGKTDLKVKTKPFLGSTQVVAQALERGDLDLYAEYTGTALLAVLGEPVNTDPQAVYDHVKQRYEQEKGIVWLEPFGFNNTYTLSMRRQQAEAMGIRSISDLAKHAGQMHLGASYEFLERPDGYQGVKDRYGLEFLAASGMDSGLTYAACRDGKVEVIDAFATDGRIPAFDLKVLVDDKQCFPPYVAAPIVRADTLKKHPEIKEALALLAGKLDNREMARLNAQVDIDKKDPQTVARQWLKEQGIL